MTIPLRATRHNLHSVLRLLSLRRYSLRRSRMLRPNHVTRHHPGTRALPFMLKGGRTLVLNSVKVTVEI